MCIIYIYIYIYIYICMNICVCIYIYIYRERERERVLDQQQQGAELAAHVGLRVRGLTKMVIIHTTVYTSRGVRVILAQGPC